MVLRDQPNALQRRSPKRLAFSNLDRLIFAGLYAVGPRILRSLAIVEPRTVVRWHRAGFRLFWCWKSQSRSGRPRVPLEISRLIREMSLANPLWGAPEDPWRTSEAWHRCGPDLRRQIHVPAHPWIASRFGRYARIAFVPSIMAAIVDHYYRTKRSKHYDFIQMQKLWTLAGSEAIKARTRERVATAHPTRHGSPHSWTDLG